MRHVDEFFEGDDGSYEATLGNDGRPNRMFLQLYKIDMPKPQSDFFE